MTLDETATLHDMAAALKASLVAMRDEMERLRRDNDELQTRLHEAESRNASLLARIDPDGVRALKQRAVEGMCSAYFWTDGIDETSDFDDWFSRMWDRISDKPSATSENDARMCMGSAARKIFNEAKRSHGHE